MRYNKKLDNGGMIIELNPINNQFLCSQAYNKWMNDLEINKYSSLCRFAVTDRDKEQLLIDIENNRAIHWSIAQKRTEDTRAFFIGTVSLQEIDIFNRSAEIALKIGDKNYWGKDIGYWVCSLVFKHGFERLNLNRIWLGTDENNLAMKRLAEKLGMTNEGHLRQALFSKGVFSNVELYSIIESEYTYNDYEKLD